MPGGRPRVPVEIPATRMFMIVSCPDCAARLRLDPQRLAGKRVTLRCARCRKVFQVAVPGAAKAETPVRVLIAHSDRELCQAVSEILSREGLDGQICHDGHEALETLQQNGAQVAVIDVALPGMLAFELIEQIRREPKLKDLRIILLSSVYNKMAYKRRPTSLYGADDYIEKHHIPDALVPKINRLVGAARSAAASVPAAGMDNAAHAAQDGYAAALSGKIQAAEVKETREGSEEEERQRARRLARIIVADIALYHQERVDEGVRSNCFYDLLASEIAEGKRLFLERHPAGEEAPLDVLEEAFETFVRQRRAELGI